MRLRVLAIWAGDRQAFVLQWKDPLTGKRRTRKCDATSRRAAERIARELEDELNSGLPQADGRTDWLTFASQYVETHGAGLKDRSESKMGSVIDVFTREMRPRKIGDVTTDRLLAYVSRLRHLGRAEATIRGHLVVLRHALKWAHQRGLIREVPHAPQIVRSASGRKAKGRPLTLPEFVRMLRVVPQVVGAEHAESWRRFLIGLWLSGLRLDEALHLTWDDPTQLRIVLDAKRPLLALTADNQKNFRDQLCPLTPDFCRFILRIPTDDRTGQVFPLTGTRSEDVRCRYYVSRKISRIGEIAGIVVEPRSGKFASAHDLRRTFGARWAHRVPPATLRELMRHANINTTLEFYALQDAEKVADMLWNTTVRTTRTRNGDDKRDAS